MGLLFQLLQAVASYPKNAEWTMGALDVAHGPGGRARSVLAMSGLNLDRGVIFSG
jgi:hypothetical protein